MSYFLGQADPLTGLAELAKGGPWVFLAVVVIGLQWAWSRTTIRLYREASAAWQELYRTESERGRIRDEQVGRMVDAIEANNRALESIAAEAARRRDTGRAR